MSRLYRLRRVARESTGAVLVLVALGLPVFIGFAGLVLDVGNWFAHKRHLQLQADAGALAGAGEFRYPCDNATIIEKISDYSSVEVTSGLAPLGLNPQIGDIDPAELHQEINSPTFYDQDEPVDTTVRGPVDDPCEAKMIDVKLTETDLPWWLKVASVPYINAHARVEFKQQTVATGALPVGVPEVDPKAVKAYFVDESLPSTDAGYVLGSVDLVESTTTPGTWNNISAPKSIAITKADVGVRIAVSETTNATCGQPLVACYDTGAGDDGLVHIRGWLGGTGTVAAPIYKDVHLLSGTCEDGYFSATATYPCGVTVSADVDFGGTVPAEARVLAQPTGGNASTEIELTPPTTGNTWTTPAGKSIAVTSGAGPVGVTLFYRDGCNPDRTKNCNTSKKQVQTVQRAFSATPNRSGAVELVRLTTSSSSAYSFRRCDGTYTTCTHDFVVTVKVKDNLENATSVSDPIVSLKVAGGGSQNQALDCGTTLPNFQQEIASGCPESYMVNTGTTCPGTATTLWNTAEPWPCVAIATGAQVGQVTHGMNERMFGDANAGSDRCVDAPNNWAEFPDFPAGDPRIIQVFLTPFNAFAGSGGTTVPVLGFASFYVTGWDGGPCQGSGGDDAAGQGSIVGHFIKYIQTINNGSGGEEFCDFNAFGSCVAVFSR
jgi:hypothetical protein